jgi:hypothetical protein
MQNRNKLYRSKLWIAIILIMTLILTMTACNRSTKDSKDPKYEAQTITIEGLDSDKKSDVSVTEISIAELRKLPQHDLDASYKRTTGLVEEFEMSGPYLKDVIEHLGGNIKDYAGIGVMGRDAYYCLLSKEVIEATPDLMLALVIDGEAKLDEDNAPARLAVQGQFGPYWVKQVEKIILYKEIPEKSIDSVWVFNNLAEGIEPYEYEYYGSKDKAIELGQIFSRLDNVDSKAFFTMKSSDGFKKNEAINMVKSRYYIKVDGKDAPTNISPYIKLGMNVHNIAWISTNADAAIFPEKMAEYMDLKEINGQKGIPLDEILYETEVESVKTKAFDILGTNGEKITVAGKDLNHGILVARKDGKASVIWETSLKYKNIDNLLRIRLNKSRTDLLGTEEGKVVEQTSEKSGKTGGTAGTIPTIGSVKPKADTILTITGDGVSRTLYLSLADLKGMKNGYLEQCYSTVNNWPTKKFSVGKGVSANSLFEQAGIKRSAKSIRIEASDGYYANLTREQLLGKRYRYPNLLKGSTANAVSAKPMFAWAFENGTQDFSRAKSCGLRFLIGQLGLHDVNTAPSVQNAVKITVSTKDPGRWQKPSASIANGKITLSHGSMDQVKLHYTLDGSEPNYNSQVYNPSASYFQPDLIQPISVSGSGTIKVKVIGYGKRDSEVLVYAY